MATAAPLAYPSALPLRDPEGLATEAPFDSAGAASRAGRGGMMELQWGGGSEGAACLNIFRGKIAGVVRSCGGKQQ